MLFLHVTSHDSGSTSQTKMSHRKVPITLPYRVAHRVQIRRIPRYLESNPSRYHREPSRSRVSPSTIHVRDCRGTEITLSLSLSLSHRVSERPRGRTGPRSLMVTRVYTAVFTHKPNLSSARYRRLGYLVARRRSPATIQRLSTVDVLASATLPQVRASESPRVKIPARNLPTSISDT